VKKGTESRSLESDEGLFTLTLDEALVVLAQPKRGRGASAKGPLREMGNDPATDAPVTLREGRFGPYVTDGTTNASLRVGDAIETLTLERAAELLQDRRDKGPAIKAKKKAKPRAATKAKTTAKRAPRTAKTSKAKGATAASTAGKGAEES